MVDYPLICGEKCGAIQPRQGQAGCSDSWGRDDGRVVVGNSGVVW